MTEYTALAELALQRGLRFDKEGIMDWLNMELTAAEKEKCDRLEKLIVAEVEKVDKAYIEMHGKPMSKRVLKIVVDSITDQIWKAA